MDIHTSKVRMERKRQMRNSFSLPVARRHENYRYIPSILARRHGSDPGSQVITQSHNESLLDLTAAAPHRTLTGFHGMTLDNLILHEQHWLSKTAQRRMRASASPMAASSPRAGRDASGSSAPGRTFRTGRGRRMAPQTARKRHYTMRSRARSTRTGTCYQGST